MLSLTKLSTLALAGLIASTSLASAGGLLLDPPKKYDIFDDGVGSDIKLTPIVIYIPEKPLKPILPELPIPAVPAKPDNPDDLAIECSVHSPSGFTDDVWFMNVGTGELESGTTIKWRIPSTDEHGAFLLPRMLASGEQIKITDLLLVDAASGAPCTVKILA